MKNEKYKEHKLNKKTESATPCEEKHASEKHKSSRKHKEEVEYRTLYNATGGSKEAPIGGVLTKTHTYIIKQALAILEHDKGPSCLTEDKFATILLVYTDWPDRLGCETDYGTWAGHFYNPETEENYKGQTRPTAMTRATRHFNSAVALYHERDYISAIEILGKGTHYVADLNEPHHASNITAVHFGSKHFDFEKYADEHRKEFYFENNTIDEVYYIKAKSMLIGHILKNAALFAHSYLDKAQDRETYHEAAEATLKSSIISTVQYLYKFGVIMGIYE